MERPIQSTLYPQLVDLIGRNDTDSIYDGGAIILESSPSDVVGCVFLLPSGRVLRKRSSLEPD